MWLFSFLSGPPPRMQTPSSGPSCVNSRTTASSSSTSTSKPGEVKRGTWDGCALSYRRGFAGSVDCDRKGRRGNAFTRFWDAERVEDAHVLRLLREEIAERQPGTQPATVEVPAPAHALTPQVT